MSTFILADELLLLAYDDAGAAQISSPQLDYGLAGAVLIELALNARIVVEDNRVVVVDPTPLGHPRLDEALTQIAADPKRRKPTHWVDRLSKRLRDRVLDGLTTAGVLRREDDTVLWVFPRTRYPAPHGAEPPVETEVRQRLVAAVRADGPVEPRTAALCALVRAVKYERHVFHELPRERMVARLTEISAGDWAAAAVKKAIEEVEAAVLTAIMVPAVGAAISSG
jgi:hypothetical protein